MERTCFGRSRIYRGREPKAVHGVVRIFAAVMFLLFTLLGATGNAQAQTDCSDTSATGVREAECQALVDLYNKTDGANWTTNTGWNTTQLVSTWHGVVVLNGQVTQLSIPQNSLSGTIPDLSGLTSLENLSLAGNSLDGTIPAWLGNLTSLQTLYLWGNELTGGIPDLLGNLTSLETLYLNNNMLTGGIPDLSGLTSLENLSLARNSLDGTIPDSLGDLTSLKNLYLNHNSLDGSIPASLENLTSLKDLYLNHNSLDGSIPAWLGDLTSLRALHLWDNGLTGGIPDLSRLASLVSLSLSQNSLDGTIPVSLGHLPILKNLYLNNNMLTGEIPASLGDLPSLQFLYLNNNMLTGATPATELETLANLKELGLWGNEGLTWDTISNELGKKVDSTVLRVLYGDSGGEEWTNNENWLPSSGDPFSFSSWYGVSADATGRVSGLNLRNNRLKGELTNAVEALDGLENLNVSNNRRLTGELPLRLMDLPLETLDIRCTSVSVPSDTAFREWLGGITFRSVCPPPPSPPSPPPLSPPPPPPSPPEQVMGVMVIEEVEQLSVSWDPVSEADGYKVQWWKSGSEQFDSSREHVITDPDTISYKISGLVAGEEYVVIVIATKSDAADDGTPSTEVTGTPDSPLPPPPEPGGGGGGCTIASDVPEGNTPESIVFNLLLVVFVLVSVVIPEKGSRQSSCVLQEIP